jgi:hypothetical protein
MQYLFRLEVPPKTPPKKPLTKTLELTAGEIRQVHIVIPSGHCGLTGIRLKLRRQVIIPASPDAWISGDDVAITLPEKLQIPDRPPRLTVEAYNEDEVYPHAFQVTITIMPPEEDLASYLAYLAYELDQLKIPITQKQVEKLLKDVEETKVELINLRRLQMDEMLKLWKQIFTVME